MALAVVRDLREARVPAGPDELAAFETHTLAGLVLARAAAGLEDSTIAGEVIHLEQVRAWLGLPLWAMQPADADDYFGQVLRGAARGTRLARAQALKTYFLFLELRHKAEIQHAGIMAATARPGTPPEPLPHRWAHVKGVAARARGLAQVLGADVGLMEAAVWLHDIGNAPDLTATGLDILRTSVLSWPA